MGTMTSVVPAYKPALPAARRPSRWGGAGSLPACSSLHCAGPALLPPSLLLHTSHLLARGAAPGASCPATLSLSLPGGPGTGRLLAGGEDRGSCRGCRDSRCRDRGTTGTSSFRLDLCQGEEDDQLSSQLPTDLTSLLFT